MTYCLAMNLEAGLVFASDSRTNAGVDNIARFEKMRVFAKDGDRVVVTLSAGNLSVTQNAMSLLDLRARNDPQALSLWNAKSLFEVAGLLGDAMREVRARDEAYLRAQNIDANASFILGGQIAGENQRLFLVYSEGNFIESSNDTPFVQIGEIKYGKPILDRIIRRQSSLSDAVKCTLVSFDSTIRSNISVGAPIDMLIYTTNSLRVGLKQRLDENDPYLVAVRQGWETGLQYSFDQLPANSWF